MKNISDKYRSGEKSLTTAQVGKLLEVVTDLQDEALLRLALTTGIRREDIVAISSNDVNLENGTVTFYEQKKRRTKTVPISGATLNTLTKWLRINKSPFLFPARQAGKKHLSGKTAYNMLNKYLEAAVLEKRPFHSLRATATKLCQRAGWKPEETAELLGDKVSTIQMHYSVPTPEELKERAKSNPIL